MDRFVVGARDLLRRGRAVATYLSSSESEDIGGTGRLASGATQWGTEAVAAALCHVWVGWRAFEKVGPPGVREWAW